MVSPFGSEAGITTCLYEVRISILVRSNGVIYHEYRVGIHAIPLVNL